MIMNMKYLGIDFGDVRTGVSVSDASCKIAVPLSNITEKSIFKVAKAIAEKVIELDITTVVVGMPVNMNGTLGPRAEKTQQLCELLRDEYSINVVTRDERLTTVSAGRIMNDLNVRGKKRKDNIDALAACLILQNYLDYLAGLRN